MPNFFLKPQPPPPLLPFLNKRLENLRDLLTNRFNALSGDWLKDPHYKYLKAKLEFKGDLNPDELLHLYRGLMALLARAGKLSVEEQLLYQTTLSSVWAAYQKAVQEDIRKKTNLVDAANKYARQLQDFIKPFATENKSKNTGYLAFLPMGNGRAALFTTPQGVTFLLDGGSDEQGGFFNFETEQMDREARFIQQAQLYRDLNVFLGKNDTTIKALLLSNGHPKNWNLLDALFEDRKDLLVETVYLGGKRKDYDSTQLFSRFLMPRVKVVTLPEDNSATKAEPITPQQKAQCANIRELYISPNAKKYQTYRLNDTVKFPVNLEETQEGALDKRGFLCIHKEENCGVFVVASNVSKDEAYVKKWAESKGKKKLEDLDKGQATSQTSLVVLIEVFDKKMLFLGDATKLIEAYLKREAVEVEKPKPQKPTEPDTTNPTGPDPTPPTPIRPDRPEVRSEEGHLRIGEEGTVTIEGLNEPKPPAPTEPEPQLTPEEEAAYQEAKKKQEAENKAALEALQNLDYLVVTENGKKGTATSADLIKKLKPKHLILNAGVNLAKAQAPDLDGLVFYTRTLQDLGIKDIDKHTIESWSNGICTVKTDAVWPVYLTGYLPPIVKISPPSAP